MAWPRRGRPSAGICTFVALPVLLLVACAIGLAAGSKSLKERFGILNVAHMVNTKAAVDWAVDQGATGVEFDIQYKDDGTISSIKHSDFAQPCDCTCACGSLAGSHHVCSVLGGKKPKFSFKIADMTGICGCYAQTHGYPEVQSYIEHVASKTAIKLLYFDTKFSKDTPSDPALQAAGRNVIALIRHHLLAKQTGDHKAVAVVNGLTRKYWKYIEAAWLELQNHREYIDRVYFTYDADNDDDVTKPVNSLSKDFKIPNVLYTTGISTCASGSAAFKRIKAAKPMLDDGRIQGLVVWTLDRKSSMQEHLDAGATAIVTNKPHTMRELLQERG